MLFGNRAFQVKMVKDRPFSKELTDEEISNRIAKLQAYSDITREFTADMANIVVTSAVVVLVTKAGCDILKIGFKHLCR